MSSDFLIWSLLMAAAASEEQHLISEEWTVQVKDFLESEGGGTVGRASMRVPMALTNTKPEAYIPQMVSLGPYHHRSLQEEAVGPYHQRLNHLSQMDCYKLNSTRDATQNKPIEDFFRQIKEMAPQFAVFYNWRIDDNEKFGYMMMVDAFFLYQFLKNGLHLLQWKASERYSEILTPTLTSIRCDIVKLENQIPLFLLTEIDNETLKDCLNSHIPHLSCFQVSHDLDIEYEGEHHLLGCMHKYVSSLLEIQNPQSRNLTCCENFMTVIDDMVAAVFALFFRHPTKQGRADFVDRYNAKELVKAGIKFKSGSDKITFDSYSDTLFLPKIVILDTYTEVMMRNLLALEFNDATRPKHVTQYVELMDSLIDTPEDVTLLQKCHVIESHSIMITDEYISKMWDGMAKALFFSGFLEDQKEMTVRIREKLIKRYYRTKIDYKNRIRTWWVDFYQEYLSTPWKTVAWLVAMYVVVLTTIQTYCSVNHC